MIVSKETQKAVMELIKQCFIENRVLDRMVSVLGVEYACNQSSSLIHRDIAHYFPSLSDKIGELCLERYNISVMYGETPSGIENYSSVSEIIHKIETNVIEFQTMMMAVCKIALDNNDINVYADLLDLMKDVNKVVEQSILLADKIDLYQSTMDFDRDIDKFWILGE